MSFLSNLFGTSTPKTAPQVKYTPPGFDAGGLNAYFRSDNSYSVTPDANRTGLVGNIAKSFGDLGDTTGQMRETVAPGFNDMLKARLTQINDSASKAIGDLRQNLGARRVLGSSFGQDTLTRANAEFSRQRDQATADNFLQSLDASNKLLVQQYDAYNKQFSTSLNELNLEASTASSLTAGAASVLAQNAQLQAKLDQQNAEFRANANAAAVSGLGKFVGFGISQVGGGGGASGPSFSGNMSQGYSADPGSLAQSSMGGGFGGAAFA